MTIKHLAALVVALLICATASAQTAKYIPLPPSQNPKNIDLPFSAAVWSGNTLYLSGWLDPDLKTHTDMKSQTAGILEDIQKFLSSQNLTLGDVVMVREYWTVDPAKDLKADGLGAQAAFSQFFGTKDQPNKPACTAVQVIRGASGALNEIDLVAVRPKRQPSPPRN